MKTNYLRISITPLLIAGIITLSGFPPQGHGNKGGNGQGKSKGQGKENRQGNNGQGNNGQGNGHGNSHGKPDKDYKVKGYEKGNSDHGQGNKYKEKGHGKDKGEYNWAKINGGKSKWIGKVKNGDYEKILGRRDNVYWDFGDYRNWKRPKDYKKVTVCHNPGGRNANPVTIRISENALNAHLNHGDQVGDCNFNYGNWPRNYITSRENVYNVYESTYENMSYSQALIQYALQRILGVRTDLNANRANYTADEIQHRDAIISNLQNRVNALQYQQDLTRQQLNTGTNIIIQL